MIAIAGVLVLAMAGLGVAVLSAVAGRNPDRAAVVVVLAAAAGGAGLLVLLGLGMLTLGIRAPGGAATPDGAVTYDAARLGIGLAGAALLLLVAGWLVRSGEWDRPGD